MMLKLLQDSLIPERIRQYYLVPKRIVGIDISKTAIRATRILHSGKSIIIEKCINQPLDSDLATPYSVRSSQALSLALEAIAPYDFIRSSLTGSTIVFKELTLPFNDPEKIAKTLQFELESTLPFSRNQAEISFITIATALNNTTIMAAATTKEAIVEQKKIFELVNAKTDLISVDMFDLYTLFQAFHPEAIPGALVVLHMDLYITRLLFIVDGQLKLSRLLNKGLTTIAKQVAQILEITPSHAMESIIRFGCQDTGKHGYCQAVEDALKDFLKDVQFTITSFSNQMNIAAFVQHIFLLGPGAEPVNIVSFAQKILGIPCTLLEPHQITKNPLISIAPNATLDQEVILSTGTALMLPMVQDFNLNTEYQEKESQTVLVKQGISALIVLSFLFLLLGMYYWRETSKLNQAIRANNALTLRSLRDENLTESVNLAKAFDEAQESVRKQEEVWFSFSAQTRFSFLKYLQALSTAIDRVGIGLKLQRLVINQKDGTLTLTGQVRDYDALKQLERSLKESNLFLNIPSLQNTKFNIPILLKNGSQE